MALSAVDKTKLGKFVRESSIGDLYYDAYFSISNRKTRYSDLDVLEYFVELLNDVFTNKKVISSNLLEKYAISIELFTEIVQENGVELDNTLLAKLISFKEMYHNYLNELNLEKVEDIEKHLDKVNIAFEEEKKTLLGGG